MHMYYICIYIYIHIRVFMCVRIYIYTCIHNPRKTRVASPAAKQKADKRAKPRDGSDPVGLESSRRVVPATSSRLPQAPCGSVADTCALKALPYHTCGAYAYTIKLQGAFEADTR